MSVIVNIYYKGENGNARKFAEEMETSGIVERIKDEIGNLEYEYFIPMEDQETVLLINEWRDQEALDYHRKTKMARDIENLREKYKLKTKVKVFNEFKEDE